MIYQEKKLEKNTEEKENEKNIDVEKWKELGNLNLNSKVTDCCRL